MTPSRSKFTEIVIDSLDYSFILKSIGPLLRSYFIQQRRFKLVIYAQTDNPNLNSYRLVQFIASKLSDFLRTLPDSFVFIISRSGTNKIIFRFYER